MPIRVRPASIKPISRTSKRFYSAPADRSIPARKQKYVPTEGKYPKGFRVASSHVGVKASNTKFDDIAFITSDVPCKAAGVFTRNLFQAAPVTVCKESLSNVEGLYRSVIINSGCANAVTGKGGIEDARSMCRAADSALGIGGHADASDKANAEQTSPTSSLVMSTGVIGQRLPIDKIIGGIPSAAAQLGDTHDHWLSAAHAICTTDTFPKLVSREFTLPTSPDGLTFRMTGMAKGAGMIHPNMGTLLGVICTDAPMPNVDGTKMLREAVDESFNRISIDGDTSTNDTVILLANAESSNFRAESGYEAALRHELSEMCISLAKLVVRDGEGATKFITLRVRGASRRSLATTVAKTIAKSPLFKTAMYGQDANWGRILCAIGYSASEHTDLIQPHDILPEKTSVSFVPATREQEEAGLKELKLLVNGEPQKVDEEVASKMLKEEDLEILIRLRPDEEALATQLDQDSAWKKQEEDSLYWTCDFSHEYVTINGDYRT